jgi:hypothetical protein
MPLSIAPALRDAVGDGHFIETLVELGFVERAFEHSLDVAATVPHRAP